MFSSSSPTTTFAMPGRNLLVVLAAAAALDVSNFVKLHPLGLGRYAGAPAFILADTPTSTPISRVLPIPIPKTLECALEDALSPSFCSMVDVLIHGRAIVERDGGLYDSLPWSWNPDAFAKRNAYGRFTGRGYPKDGYASPYHLLLDMCRREACADVGEVLIENTDLLGRVVLGGAVLVERRLPMAKDSGLHAAGAGPAPAEDARWWVRPRGRDADAAARDQGKLRDGTLCECTTDEAVGLAVALGRQLLVETAVWEAAAQPARFTMQRGKMRVELQPPAGAAALDVLERELDAPLAWEIETADELRAMSVEEKARVVLASGLRLPRARDATDEALTEILEPYLDEEVRRTVRLNRALSAGDFALARALEGAQSKRAQAAERMAAAVEAEDYEAAAAARDDLAVEELRRADVSQDEGEYNRFLDQDDWYARGLLEERKREEKREREKANAKRREEEAQEAKKAAAAAAEAAKRSAERQDDLERLGRMWGPPPAPPPPDGAIDRRSPSEVQRASKEIVQLGALEEAGQRRTSSSSYSSSVRVPAAEEYYALLGVERGASRAEVKRAYYAAAKECHPDAAAADAAAFRQLTDAYAIVCAEILADDRRRGGGRGRREGGGSAQPSTAEIMREITDDILEMVEMDVEGEEAGPRGWLPPAG